MCPWVCGSACGSLCPWVCGCVCGSLCPAQRPSNRHRLTIGCRRLAVNRRRLRSKQAPGWPRGRGPTPGGPLPSIAHQSPGVSPKQQQMTAAGNGWRLEGEVRRSLKAIFRWGKAPGALRGRPVPPPSQGPPDGQTHQLLMIRCAAPEKRRARGHGARHVSPQTTGASGSAASPGPCGTRRSRRRRSSAS